MEECEQFQHALAAQVKCLLQSTQKVHQGETTQTRSEQ